MRITTPPPPSTSEYMSDWEEERTKFRAVEGEMIRLRYELMQCKAAGKDTMRQLRASR